MQSTLLALNFLEPPASFLRFSAGNGARPRPADAGQVFDPPWHCGIPWGRARQPEKLFLGDNKKVVAFVLKYW
jgi:hypothetical protein